MNRTVDIREVFGSSFVSISSCCCTILTHNFSVSFFRYLGRKTLSFFSRSTAQNSRIDRNGAADSLLCGMDKCKRRLDKESHSSFLHLSPKPKRQYVVCSCVYNQFVSQVDAHQPTCIAYSLHPAHIFFFALFAIITIAINNTLLNRLFSRRLRTKTMKKAGNNGKNI